jgi:hypothetical protein
MGLHGLVTGIAVPIYLNIKEILNLKWLKAYNKMER